MRTKILSRLIIYGFVLSGLRASFGAGDLKETVADRLGVGTVFISSELSASPRDWDALPREATASVGSRPSRKVSGSGFLISRDGYVLTNAHVIDGVTILFRREGNQINAQIAPPDTRESPFDAANPNQPFTIRFNSGGFKVVVRSGEKQEREFAPKVIRSDADADLALLKIDSGEKFTCLELDAKAEIKAGNPVAMAGFPGGTTADIAPFANADNADSLESRHPRVSLNSGMITSIRQYKKDKRYQLDIRANHGNSGGPIVNAAGHVIAVLYSGIDQMQSIDYAIPISYAKKVISPDLRSELSLDLGASGDSGDQSGDQSFDEFLKSGSFSFGKKK